MIYFAFVHSHLLYGVEVYANTTVNHHSKLITLNNKLLRILQNKSIKTHNSELYRTYFTLPSRHHRVPRPRFPLKSRKFRRFAYI